MLILIREFELQNMKEFEILGIANKARLLGFEFVDSRIVQKLIIIVLKRFETTILALENLKNPSMITLAKLLNALHNKSKEGS